MWPGKIPSHPQLPLQLLWLLQLCSAVPTERTCVSLGKSGETSTMKTSTDYAG